LPGELAEKARAKVNLTLRVLGRRADGYHELESLVVFADLSDTLTLAPGSELTLAVRGSRAAQAGNGDDNLVLKAARALALLIPGLTPGAFHLDKNLPVAAGIGGGSADAAAALRLLARLNGLDPGDERLYAAARATGADVPVCLSSRVRLMSGIGERLSEPLPMPQIHAVLVNPGVAVATRDVFGRWAGATAPLPPIGPAAAIKVRTPDDLLVLLNVQPNDLEAAAIAVAPAIANVLDALRAASGCRLARMSGSGATCFGIFESAVAAKDAATVLRGEFPNWWVEASALS
jgi:4-diphosphocytidyl-2-C-methyl-D-erythritol kinase